MYSCSVQSLSCVQLFATQWTSPLRAPLTATISQSLLKLRSIESVMLSNHVILCCPLLLLPSIFPASGFFQWVSSLHQVAKLLELQLQHQSFQWKIQGWFPLGWTGWVSLQSKGLSRIFSSTRVQKHQFFGTQLFYGSILTSICDYGQNHSFDLTDRCWQSDISAFYYAA